MTFDLSFRNLLLQQQVRCIFMHCACSGEKAKIVQLVHTAHWCMCVCALVIYCRHCFGANIFVSFYFQISVVSTKTRSYFVFSVVCTNTLAYANNLIVWTCLMGSIQMYNYNYTKKKTATKITTPTTIGKFLRLKIFLD